MGQHLTGGKDIIDIKATLKKLILSISRDHKGGLGDEDLLIETGVLDSLGVLKLVSAIEEEFGVVVQDEELIPENFQTVNEIVAFIEKKRTAS